ncbi:MAG: aldo/keto reductase [Candidatus Saccharimonadales bacterium]
MDSTIKLNNNTMMPLIGLGTWEIGSGLNNSSTDNIKNAISLGYRLIDTARAYDNEAAVGEAVRASGIPREEIFITTKLANEDQGRESAVEAFDASLERLGLDYVDLYLVHWPVEGKIQDTWRAMESIQASGRARAIGVSNFSSADIMSVLSIATVLPAVNQIPCQPFLYKKQKPLIDFCKSKGIAIQAYSPLTHGVKLQDELLREIASKYYKTSAQIMLRWAVEHQIVPIPKSSSRQRLAENIDIFDFKISANDMEQLDALGSNIF